METSAGGGYTGSWMGSWIGGVVALNQARNVWTDGFVLRYEGVVGRYDSDSPFTNGHVAHFGGGLLFGYRAKMNDALVTGYIGTNFEHHDNPDLSSKIRGTEGGVKGIAEIYTPLGPMADFYGQVSYSTVFQTWMVFGRLGYKISENIWIGPEGQLFGSEAPYREGRLGGFIRFEKSVLGGDLSFSGGYREPLTAGGSGYYATVALGFRFY